jgi:hypothetical protein
MQIVQVAFGDKSRELADHLDTIGNFLSKEHKFKRAQTLLEHSLVVRKDICHASHHTDASGLQTSYSHISLAQHMLRSHQQADGGSHAMEALKLCIGIMQADGSELPTAQRWTASMLESLCKPLQHQQTLANAVTQSQPRLKNFVMRQAAKIAAEAFILLSSIVLMQERGVLAVTYAINAGVCARFASGAKNELVSRAQAQLCSCTVAGLADRLQLPLPPALIPSLSAQLNLDIDRQIRHMCSMAPFAQAVPDYLEVSGLASPGKENSEDDRLQKGIVVPRLDLDKARKVSMPACTPRLAGQASPRLTGKRQSLTSRYSVCSARSDGSACSDTLAGIDSSTDQGLQTCMNKLSKSVSTLSKAPEVNSEALAHALLDLAHLCDAMARSP